MTKYKFIAIEEDETKVSLEMKADKLNDVLMHFRDFLIGVTFDADMVDERILWEIDYDGKRGN